MSPLVAEHLETCFLITHFDYRQRTDKPYKPTSSSPTQIELLHMNPVCFPRCLETVIYLGYLH